MTLVGLVFLLLALLLVLSVMFPVFNFRKGLVLTPQSLITLTIGLIVLLVLYLIVVGLFGAGPVVTGAR